MSREDKNQEKKKNTKQMSKGLRMVWGGHTEGEDLSIDSEKL